MTEEKKSTYKGFTEAQARAHRKYIARFVEVKVRMEPEQRDVVKDHASVQGESLNAFINRAISETMERDNAKRESES